MGPATKKNRSRGSQTTWVMGDWKEKVERREGVVVEMSQICAIACQHHMIVWRRYTDLASRVKRGGQDPAAGEGSQPDGDGGDRERVVGEGGKRSRRVHRRGIQ